MTETMMVVTIVTDSADERSVIQELMQAGARTIAACDTATAVVVDEGDWTPTRGLRIEALFPWEALTQIRDRLAPFGQRSPAFMLWTKEVTALGTDRGQPSRAPNPAGDGGAAAA